MTDKLWLLLIGNDNNNNNLKKKIVFIFNLTTITSFIQIQNIIDRIIQ